MVVLGGDADVFALGYFLSDINRHVLLLSTVSDALSAAVLTPNEFLVPR